MKKIKVLAILPYEGLKELVTTIANDYEQIELTTMIGDLGAGAGLAAHADENEYDIVLSRGGTAQMIMDIIEIPVINIDVSGYDIFRVIKLAQSYSGKSALVGFPNITQGAGMICELLQSSLRINTIHSEEEAVSVLDTLRHDGFSVIIGDVVTIRLAKKYGFNGILLTSGVDSVKRAFEELIKAYTYINTSRIQTKLYKSVTDNASNATIVFSIEGQILYKSNHTIPDEFIEGLKTYIKSVLDQGFVEAATVDKNYTWSIRGRRIQVNSDQCAAFYVGKVLVNSSEMHHGIRFINENDKNSISFFAFVDNNEPLSDTIMQATEYAKTNSPVLIIGENGTGKSTLAYTMHLNSARRHNTFISFDCECIGIEQWKAIAAGQHTAFSTDRDYSQFTVYFHRIDALSMEAQKLFLAYMAIERKNGLPRIIASSNIPLESIIERGSYCGELYSSVSFLNLYILPLRKRRAEIGNFVSLFISKYNEKYGKQIAGIDEEALEKLQDQRWEGNIDHLANITEEMVLLCEGLSISVYDVERAIKNRTIEADTSKGKLTIYLDKKLDVLTAEIITAVLERQNMNHSRAAEILGISRSTLWRRLKDMGEKNL